jgi:hypothetical protein
VAGSAHREAGEVETLVAGPPQSEDVQLRVLSQLGDTAYRRRRYASGGECGAELIGSLGLGEGDTDAAQRLQDKLDDINRAIEDVDYRAANIRAGYVYVISNIGAFGESMVKVGMTRRLDPLDRVRELGDASVPFRYDVHALFFSDDAVGIETALHQRLADKRVNVVNPRREFFHATAAEVKVLLGELAGDLLQFEDFPEALEYRQGLAQRTHAPL